MYDIACRVDRQECLSWSVPGDYMLSLMEKSVSEFGHLGHRSSSCCSHPWLLFGRVDSSSSPTLPQSLYALLMNILVTQRQEAVLYL